LKPNPLTVTDYLELLIDSEEAMQTLGWKERVKQYNVLLKGAEILKKVSHLEIEEDRKDKGKWSSLWTAFKFNLSSATGYGEK